MDNRESGKHDSPASRGIEVFIHMSIRLKNFLSGFTARRFKESDTQSETIEMVNERIQTLLDATPLACRLWDRNFNMIGFNKESLRLFNVNDEQAFADRYFDLSPKHQPDGTNSKDKAKELISRAFDGEHVKVEWLHRTMDGVLFPSEITLIRVPYGGDYAVAGYTRDLREQKKMLAEIEKRGVLLSIGNRTAETLLTVENELNIDESLLKSMEIVGISTEADRVQIWQNTTRDGELGFIHVYEWLSEYGRKCGPVPIGLYYSFSDTPQWDKLFIGGEHINGPVSTLPQGDREFLSSFGMKSIVMLPLFIQDTFWGIFTLDDCRRERVFSEDEIRMMRAVSLMMANAINRSVQAEKLREAHERARVLLDATPFGANLWNEDCKIFDCNEESVKLFGLSSKEEYLERFYDLSPEFQPDGESSYEKSISHIRIAFEQGRCECEWMHRLPDGTPLPAEAILVRVPYGDGYAVAGYTRDLREHKKMMREIEERDELLSTVNKKLEEALDAATKANRAKSDFLANMSHEMRTPLNAVIGLSGLSLDAGKLSGDDQSNIEKVYNSGTTLLNLVNDILDISKIEAGMLELNEIDYDVPSMINDTITQNILRIGDKPIRFILSISDDMPRRLHGDDLRIKQIINNLLSNAIKYTDEGEVEFILRCEREADFIRLIISIRDTGRGIRQEDIADLFKDYTQMDHSSNRQIEGTGLGLPITNRLADLMDGDISVESEYGVGSTFTVKLRQASVTQEVIGADVMESLKNFHYIDGKRNRHAQINRIRLPYAHVLIVDDNKTNLDVAKGLMKPYGMRIDCVDSGMRALEAVSSGDNTYDAVFMDHMMPGMDGIEAARAIRAIDSEYAKNLPIIAFTANAIAGNEEMYLSEGFQAYLTKPIDISRLDDIIKHWVRNKEKEKEYEDSGENLDRRAGRDRRVADRRTDTTDSASLEIAIRGIDVEKGIERFNGDADMYLDILHSFASNTRPLIGIISSPGSANLSEYATTVHGIKGSARGICAYGLGDLAEKLEKAAKASDIDYVLNHNELLLDSIHTLIYDIENLLSSKAPMQDKPQKSKPDESLLEKLRDACEKYSMDDVEDIMAEIDEYQYSEDNGLVEWLKENVHLTNFKHITQRLARGG